MDVVLAIDASGSVLEKNWNQSLDFALGVANTFFSANPLSRVGLIEFSAVANEAIPSTSNQRKFAKEIEKLMSRYIALYNIKHPYAQVNLKPTSLHLGHKGI